MALIDQITEDIKTAMKAKDALKLDALRAIKSQLLLAQSAEGGSGSVSDEEGLKILQKLVKQRKESAEIYKNQNREDLMQKELNEAAYIEAYLPKPVSMEELENVVKRIISETGASSIKDMGKVMGLANKELAGKVDGKTLSEKVKQLLGA